MPPSQHTGDSLKSQGNTTRSVIADIFKIQNYYTIFKKICQGLFKKNPPFPKNLPDYSIFYSFGIYFIEITFMEVDYGDKA